MRFITERYYLQPYKQKPARDTLCLILVSGIYFTNAGVIINQNGYAAGVLDTKKKV
jgi:hypothetical protein